MSNEYWEIVQFKEKKGGGKWAFRLGRAQKRDDGGFWLNLDAVPLGEGSIAVVPQREKPVGGAATKRPDDLEDSVPF